MDNQKQTHPRLLALPAELQLLIARFATWPALTSLRLTCRRLSNVIDDQVLFRQRAILTAAVKADEALLAEHISREIAGISYPPTDQTRDTQDTSGRPADSTDIKLVHIKPCVALRTFQPQSPFIYVFALPRHPPRPWSNYQPCYRCLQWLPCSVTDNLSLLLPNNNTFSRQHARDMRYARIGAHLHPLPWSYTRAEPGLMRRTCIPCGMRCGFYKPGMRVAHHLICVGCGKLEYRGRPFKQEDDYWIREAPEARFWFGQPGSGSHLEEYYCLTCQEKPDVWLLGGVTVGCLETRLRRSLRISKKERAVRGRERRAALGLVRRCSSSKSQTSQKAK